MRNKILKALLVLILVMPLNLWALGLGELTVYSTLNQPLDAEIELTNTRPSEVEKLIVKLGGAQEFVRANIERPFFLTKLNFTTEIKSDGRAVVKINSKEPIREPFLNFLIDAEWPQGRLLREYTILLDPPSFSQETSMAESVVPESVAGFDQGSKIIERPLDGVDDSSHQLPAEMVEAQHLATAQQPASELSAQDLAWQQEVPPTAVAGEIPDLAISLDDSVPYTVDSILNADEAILTAENEALLRDSNEYIYRDKSAPAEVASKPSEPALAIATTAAAADEYTIRKGDYLMAIANRFKPAGVNANQAMVAILKQNPHAFINGNVNLIKAGAKLQIPSGQQMQAYSKGNALAKVVEHNSLWREYRQKMAASYSPDTQQATATTAAKPTEQAAPVSTEPVATTDDSVQLSLLKPDLQAGSEAGVDSGVGQQQALTNSLNLAREELSASELKKQDLSEQIQELESISVAAKGVLELKSKKLAQLQQLSSESAAGDLETTDVALLEQPLDDQAMIDELGADEQYMSEDAQAATELGDEITDDELILDDAGNVIVAPQQPAAPQQPPVVETEPEPTLSRPAGVGGFIFDFLPAPMQTMLHPYLSGSLPMIVLGIILALALFLLFKDKILAKAKDEPLRPLDAESTMRFDVEDKAVKKNSLLDKIKALFNKKDKSSAAVEDVFEPGDDFDSSGFDDPVATDLEQEIPDLGLDAATAGTAEPSPSPLAATQTSSADVGEDDDQSDDTTAEADVYLAYGLYDQAEDLLKQAIAQNPQNIAYQGKLIETYFNSGKKDELIAQAQQLKEIVGDRTSSVWNKAVVLGKEIAPENPLFSGETASGSAADYEVEKPIEADIDLGADDGDSSPDFDLSADSQDIDLESASIESSDVTSDIAPLLSDDGKDEFDLSDVASELEADDLSAADSLDDGINIELDIPGEESAAAADDYMATAIDDIGATDSQFEATDSEQQDDISFDFTEADSSDDGLDIDAAASLDFDDAVLDSQAVEEVNLEDDEELLSIQDDLETLSSLTFEDSDLDDEDSPLSDFSSPELDLPADDGGSMESGVLDDSMFDDTDGTSLIDETMMDSSGLNFADGDDEEVPDSLDEVGTKLDLAKAYIDMEDKEGARMSLEEVLEDGNEAQKEEAQSLLDSL